MGIKDRDSVGSQEVDDTTTNSEQVPMDQVQPTPAVGEPVALRTVAPVEVPAWQALLLPLLLTPSAPVLTPDAAPVPVQAELCPVCAAAADAAPTQEETAVPIQDASLGLTALALAGFLSFLHQIHKKERPENDEEE